MFFESNGEMEDKKVSTRPKSSLGRKTLIGSTEIKYIKRRNTSEEQSLSQTKTQLLRKPEMIIIWSLFSNWKMISMIRDTSHAVCSCASWTVYARSICFYCSRGPFPWRIWRASVFESAQTSWHFIARFILSVVCGMWCSGSPYDAVSCTSSCSCFCLISSRTAAYFPSLSPYT